MSAYEIMISAQQRELLTHACRETLKTLLTPKAREELEILHSLFADLPPADSDANFEEPARGKKRRHILHGFCL